MNDLIALCITLLIVAIGIIYSIIDVFKYKRAYNPHIEKTYRLAIPIVVIIIQQIIFILVGWSPLTLPILILFFVNAYIFYRLSNTDTFFEFVLGLRRIGRRSLFLNYYLQADDELDANIFQWKKHSTSFKTVIKIIEENKLDQQEPEQFETEEKRTQYRRFKEAYERRKEEADKYRVDILGYADFLFGFKILLYVHDGEIPDRVIEGDCIPLPQKEIIEGHEFEKIVCFKGETAIERQRRLEAAMDYLDILSSLTLLENARNLQARLEKKDELLEDQRRSMREMRTDIILADESTKYSSPQSMQGFDMKKFGQYIFKMIIGFTGLIVTLILLMVFGVI